MQPGLFTLNCLFACNDMQFFTYVLNAIPKMPSENKFDSLKENEINVWKKKFALEKTLRKKYATTTTVFETATFGLLLRKFEAQRASFAPRGQLVEGSLQWN